MVLLTSPQFNESVIQRAMALARKVNGQIYIHLTPPLYPLNVVFAGALVVPAGQWTALHDSPATVLDTLELLVDMIPPSPHASFYLPARAYTQLTVTWTSFARCRFCFKMTPWLRDDEGSTRCAQCGQVQAVT